MTEEMPSQVTRKSHRLPRWLWIPVTLACLLSLPLLWRRQGLAEVRRVQAEIGAAGLIDRYEVWLAAGPRGDPEVVRKFSRRVMDDPLLENVDPPFIDLEAWVDGTPPPTAETAAFLTTMQPLLDQAARLIDDPDLVISSRSLLPATLPFTVSQQQAIFNGVTPGNLIGYHLLTAWGLQACLEPARTEAAFACLDRWMERMPPGGLMLDAMVHRAFSEERDNAYLNAGLLGCVPPERVEVWIRELPPDPEAILAEVLAGERLVNDAAYFPAERSGIYHDCGLRLPEPLAGFWALSQVGRQVINLLTSYMA